ncbi:MAG: phosphotransferase family protein [Caulobacter sp.]|nr:phosphotransferase family protein [Caulobacter sp.]
MAAGKDDLRGTIGEQTRNSKAQFAQVDAARLHGFIEGQPDVVGQVKTGPIEYLLDGAGSSNGIAFFEAELDRGDGRRRQDYVLRYFPGVTLLRQKSYKDEYLTLQAARAAGLPTPMPLWLDEDGKQLGCIGYVMERVSGDAPSAAMYSKGPLANVTPEKRKALMLQAATFHGTLRKAAIGADRVPHLVGRGEGATAIERELQWWLTEARFVCSADDARLAYVQQIHDWMVANQPPAYEPGLVHGDAQIANIMFRDGQLASVLDWELSYLGHNESDLALLVFITESQKLLDQAVEGTPSEAEYIAAYEAAAGAPVESWAYFKLFSQFKVTCIALMMADRTPSFETVWAYYAAQVAADFDAARASAALAA